MARSNKKTEEVVDAEKIEESGTIEAPGAGVTHQGGAPKGEPEPSEHPTGKVNLTSVSRVLRRSNLRPRDFDLPAIVEAVNVKGATIQDAAAANARTGIPKTHRWEHGHG